MSHGEKEVFLKCRQCSETTRHIVLKEEEVSNIDEEEAVYETCHYRVLQCSGCNSGIFQETIHTSESWAPEKVAALLQKSW